MVMATNNGTSERRAFQELKTQLHRQMVDSIDLSKAGDLNDDELRQQLRALGTHLCSLHSNRLAERRSKSNGRRDHRRDLRLWPIAKIDERPRRQRRACERSRYRLRRTQRSPRTGRRFLRQRYASHSIHSASRRASRASHR